MLPPVKSNFHVPSPWVRGPKRSEYDVWGTVFAETNAETNGKIGVRTLQADEHTGTLSPIRGRVSMSIPSIDLQLTDRGE